MGERDKGRDKLGEQAGWGEGGVPQQLLRSRSWHVHRCMEGPRYDMLPLRPPLSPGRTIRAACVRSSRLQYSGRVGSQGVNHAYRGTPLRHLPPLRRLDRRCSQPIWP